MWKLHTPNQNSLFGDKIEPLWMTLCREMSGSMHTDAQIKDIAISEGINVTGKDRATICKELGIFYEERLKKEGGGIATINEDNDTNMFDNIFDGAPDKEELEDDIFADSIGSYDGGDLKTPFSGMQDELERKEENPFGDSNDEDLSDPFATDKEESLSDMLKRGDEDDEMNPFEDENTSMYERDNVNEGGGNCDWDYNQGVNLGYANTQEAADEAYQKGYDEALLMLQDENMMAYNAGRDEGYMVADQAEQEAFQRGYQIAEEQRNEEIYNQGLEQGISDTYRNLDDVYENERQQAYSDGYQEAVAKSANQFDDSGDIWEEAYKKGKEAATSEFRKRDDDYQQDYKKREDDFSDRKYKDDSDDEMLSRDDDVVKSSSKDEKIDVEKEKELIAQAEREMKKQEYKQLEEELNLVSPELQEPVTIAKELMERIEKVARRSDMEVEQVEESMAAIKEMTGLMSKHKEIYNKWASGLMSSLGNIINRNLEYEIEDVENIRKNVNKINMINDIRMSTIIEFDQAKKDIKDIINSALISPDVRGVYTLYKIKYRFDVAYNRVMEYNHSRINQLWGRAWSRLGKFDSGDIIPQGIEEAGKIEVPKIETILVQDPMPTMAEVEAKMKRAKYIKDNTGDKDPKIMIQDVKTLIEETKEELEEYKLLDEIVVKSMPEPANPVDSNKIPLSPRFVFGNPDVYAENPAIINDNIVKFRTPPKPLVHGINNDIYKDPTKAASDAMLSAEEFVSLDKIEEKSARKHLEAQFKSDILIKLHEFSNQNMEKIRAIQEETETAKSKVGFTKSNISDDIVIEVLKTRKDLKNHIQTTNEVINSAIKDAVFSLIPEMSTIKDNFNTAVIEGVQYAVNKAPQDGNDVTNLITGSGIEAKKKAIELNMYPKYVQGAAATAAAIVSNYYQLALPVSVNASLPAAAKAAVEAGADSSTMTPVLIAAVAGTNIAERISDNGNVAHAYADNGAGGVSVIDAIRRAVTGNIAANPDPQNLVRESLLAAIVTSAVSSNLAVHSLGGAILGGILVAGGPAQVALEGKKPAFRILTDAIADAIDNDNTGFIGGVKISDVKTLMTNANQSVSRSIEELPSGGDVYAEAVLESKKADESAENAIELVASVSQPSFIQAVTVAKLNSKEANEKLLDAALDINRRKMVEYRIVGGDVDLIHEALKNIILDGDDSIKSVINTIREIDGMLTDTNRLQILHNDEINYIINTPNPLPAVPIAAPPAGDENKLHILNLISATTFACSITSNPFIVDIIISNQPIFDDIVKLFNKLGVGNVIAYYDSIIDFVEKIVDIYRIDIATGNAFVGGAAIGVGGAVGIAAAALGGGPAGIAAAALGGGPAALALAALAAANAAINSALAGGALAGGALAALAAGGGGGAAANIVITNIANSITALIINMAGPANDDDIINITTAGFAVAENTEYTKARDEINASLLNNNLMAGKIGLILTAFLHASRAAYAIIKNARMSDVALKLKRISDSKKYPKLTFSIKEVIKNIENAINLKDIAIAAASSTIQKLGKYTDALEASVKAIDSAALLAIGTNENIPRFTTLPIPFRNAREELRFDMYSEVNLGDSQSRIKIKNEKIFKSELLSIFAKRSYVFLEHSNVHIKTLDNKVINEVINSLTKINLQYKNAVPYFKNLHDVEVKKGGNNLSIRKQKEKDLEKARENVEISKGNLDFVVALKTLIESMEPNIGEIRKFIYDSIDNFIELQKAVVESKNNGFFKNLDLLGSSNFSNSSKSIIEISDRVYKSIKLENKEIEKHSSYFIKEAEKAKADAEYAEERVPISEKEDDPTGVFGIRRDKYMPGYITRVRTEYEKIKRGNATALTKRQFLALSMYILNGEIARMNHSIYATRIVKQGIYEEDIDAPVLRILRNEMIKQAKMVKGMRAEIYETREVLTKLKESNTLIVYGGADAAVETNKEEAKKAQREARFAMEEARSLFELIKPGKEPENIPTPAINNNDSTWGIIPSGGPPVSWFRTLLEGVIGINNADVNKQGSNENNWYADGNSAVESTLASARSQVRIAKIRGLTSNEARKATETLYKLNLIVTTFVKVLVKKTLGEAINAIFKSEPKVSEMREKIAELIKNIAEIRAVLADLLNLVETGGSSAGAGSVGDGNCDKGEKKKILGELQNAMNIIFNRTMTYMSRAGIKFDTYNQVAESNTFNYINSIVGNNAIGDIDRVRPLSELLTAAVTEVINTIANNGAVNAANSRNHLGLIFDRDHAIVANMFKNNLFITDVILGHIYDAINGGGGDAVAYIESIAVAARTAVQVAVIARVSDEVVKRAAAAAAIVATSVIGERVAGGAGYLADGQAGAIAGARAASIIPQNANIVGQVALTTAGNNNQADNITAGALAAERAARFIIEENPLLKGEIAQEGAQKDVIIREKNAAVDKFLELVPQADNILGVRPSDTAIAGTIANNIYTINVNARAKWNDNAMGNVMFATREGKGVQPKYDIPQFKRFDGSDTDLGVPVDLNLPNDGDINGENIAKSVPLFTRHEQRLKNYIDIIESKINMAISKINELKQTYTFQSIDNRVTAEVNRFWTTYLENNANSRAGYIGNNTNNIIDAVGDARADAIVAGIGGSAPYIQAAFPVLAGNIGSPDNTRKLIQDQKNTLTNNLIRRNTTIYNTYLASLENTKYQLENALRPYKEKLEEIQKVINTINESDRKIAEINDKIGNITRVDAGGGGLGASNIGLSPMSVATDIVYKVKKFVGSSSLKKDISERNKVYGDLYGALRFVITVDNQFFQKLDGNEFDNFTPETKIKICNAIDELDKSGKLLTSADDSIASLPEPKDEEEAKNANKSFLEDNEFTLDKYISDAQKLVDMMTIKLAGNQLIELNYSDPSVITKDDKSKQTTAKNYIEKEASRYEKLNNIEKLLKYITESFKTKDPLKVGPATKVLVSVLTKIKTDKTKFNDGEISGIIELGEETVRNIPNSGQGQKQGRKNNNRNPANLVGGFAPVTGYRQQQPGGGGRGGRGRGRGYYQNGVWVRN